MLLNSVILILREVLEAALLISAMLSLSHFLKISLSWLKWSIGIGMLSTWAYSTNLIHISNWFEGVGQEVSNAFIQYIIYTLLALLCIWLIKKNLFSRRSLQIITWIMGAMISLSMIREFSEIFIYLQVFSSDSQQFTGVMMGAFLGASIGLSLGTLFYHLLNYLGDKGSLSIIIVVLSFIAAGMLSQATQLLIQADWLASHSPLWDSSAWISERSIVGQLLYAVFGYESTPSLIEVSVYFTGLFIILFFVLRQFWLNRSTIW
jgi:high-affinity iron transporter